jgi:hypothetical protein
MSHSGCPDIRDWKAMRSVRPMTPFREFSGRNVPESPKSHENPRKPGKAWVE